MKWYYYSVFITIAGRGVSQLSLCLKCSLEQSTSLSPDDSVACCRGFVAPNTGDRLCGITVCAWAVYNLCSSVRQFHQFFVFNAHKPSPSSYFEHLNQVVSGYYARCLATPELAVWSAFSSQVVFNRVSVTTWKTNHLVLCSVFFC